MYQVPEISDQTVLGWNMCSRTLELQQSTVTDIVHHHQWQPVLAVLDVHRTGFSSIHHLTLVKGGSETKLEARIQIHCITVCELATCILNIEYYLTFLTECWSDNKTFLHMSREFPSHTLHTVEPQRPNSRILPQGLTSR